MLIKIQSTIRFSPFFYHSLLLIALKKDPLFNPFPDQGSGVIDSLQPLGMEGPRFIEYGSPFRKGMTENGDDAKRTAYGPFLAGHAGVRKRYVKAEKNRYHIRLPYR
jgi:hypothetical protein